MDFLLGKIAKLVRDITYIKSLLLIIEREVSYDKISLFLILGFVVLLLSHNG